jgi:nucleotide-binding universal stress UspA family protein
MTAATTTTERRRIVVGVDGSAASLDALRWAGRLGTALGCELDAVTSWAYPMSYGMTALPVEWIPADDAARALATALESAFGDDRPEGLRSRVVEGNPAAVLIEASADAELLIVGSRGHGGFVGLLIGSVSAACAEHAGCPVLVTRSAP